MMPRGWWRALALVSVTAAVVWAADPLPHGLPLARVAVGSGLIGWLMARLWEEVPRW